MRNSPLTLEQIALLYTERAAARYGSELVSQLEHAQQCVQLARAEGAGEELAAAAFLHDIGHLAARRPLLVGREIDDLHQYVAVPLLRGLFGPGVLEPIRLHVEAKRFLCHAESGYWERLSPASKHSLELQGGPHTAAEATAFLEQRYARDAVRLRRWDDRAKVPGAALPPRGLVARLLEGAAGCHKTAMAGA
jgi:phosphonate degradation associated HDIG domain protein